MDKGESIWIGASSNYLHKPLKLKWTKGATCLGVYITNNLQEISDINFSNKLQKIEDILGLWALRKLTLTGKVRVTNMLIAPQLLYICSVIHMPKQYVEQYPKIITKFLWNNKPPKVKYKAMINSVEKGGLGLQDITCKNKSLKIMWIKKLLDDEYISPWKAYLNTQFKGKIAEVILYNYTDNMYPKLADEFYNEMFNLWANIHYKIPRGNEQICRQALWNNANLKTDGRCFNYNTWKGKKINYIQDIVRQDGHIITQNELEKKYSIICRPLEYQRLVHAIPSTWKKELIQHKTVNMNYYVYNECKVNIQGKHIAIEELKH
jgi:hypothetical protein